jgi:hypothetical protein
VGPRGGLMRPYDDGGRHGRWVHGLEKIIKDDTKLRRHMTSR